MVCACQRSDASRGRSSSAFDRGSHVTLPFLATLLHDKRKIVMVRGFERSHSQSPRISAIHKILDTLSGMMIRAEDALVDIALSTGLGDKSPLVWLAAVVMARVLGMWRFDLAVCSEMMAAGLYVI